MTSQCKPQLCDVYGPRAVIAVFFFCVEINMAVLLATFLSTVRGVRFYDVSVSSVRAGGRVALQLEPTNIYDSNCVAVYLRSSLFSDMLGHLARERFVLKRTG